MARKFTEKKLIVASHNEGKVREIGALLKPFGLTVVSAGELGLPEPVEDGDTFLANADIKSLAAARAGNLPALADDSGLAVDALGGEPGIYSARWGGPDKDFNMAMEAVIIKADEADYGNRAAHFTCALSLAWPDGHVEHFEGKVYGDLVWPPSGKNGFGYDPFFMPEGHDITFGEMEQTKKHKMSHRANAFRLMIDACFN